MQKIANNFIFIIGRGRSGTTLLRRLLSLHPKICIAPESFFIIALVKKYSHIKQWHTSRLQAFYDDLISEPKLKNWQLNKEKLYDAIMSHDLNTNYTALCKSVYKLYAEQQGKSKFSLVGDKNPEYSLHLKTLQKMFPEAKFIYLSRNPKDNITSFQQVNFDLSNPLLLAQRWCQYNDAILDFQAKHPNLVLNCKYENLCSNPKNELAKILAFLGVTDNDDIDFSSISEKNINKWQANDSICSKNKIIDSICYTTAKKLGCPLENLRLSFLEKLAKFSSKYISQLVFACEKLLFNLPIGLQQKIYKIYKSSNNDTCC